ncbi:MupA/Atu3671 family FMN-dependent luciferase-like monooxygenase [Nocardia sp. NPDC051990]|uniref:type I polyketide synthase n=1 Tax=Nocardia sp. NPDC051990 TaxID=3155285 RepID=UPI003432C91F
MRGDDIAIVGMAGRFPGAADIAEFWRNLVDERESIVMSSDGSGAYGVLADIDMFDAEFFGFPPAEAELLDPQHRLFLECAWHALENAGCPPDRFGTETGVFASASPSTYLLHTLLSRYRDAGPTEQHRILLATDKDYLATRTSYKLDLQGPSIGVQTACSSSLVAVHLACQSLLAGDCGVALVGASAIDLPQAAVGEHVDGAIVSADGRCRPFDAAASGTVRGNGVAAVVLRRVSDAVRDGNRIRAVILGSAVVNDGRRKIGYAAPGWDGQVRAVSQALARAGLASTEIGFVEAHGTGTPIGDPIELSALAEAFRLRRDGDAVGSSLLGSVKSNIGHLDAAAGITGLIKSVLAVETGTVPATLHFTEPNPEFDWETAPFTVNPKTVEWLANRAERRCGVSSLGIGGTNAHVVLGGWDEPPRRSAHRSSHVVTLSAQSAAALDTGLRDLHRHLDQHRDLNPADVAYTTQMGRSALRHRAFALVDPASNPADVVGASTPVDRGGPIGLAPKISFLFPGQGAQYQGLGRELWPDFEIFREEHDRCLDLLALATGIPLREQLFGSEPAEFGNTVLTQSAVFAAEFALARTWQRLGVGPDTMIGHSLGEIVAATIAGVLSVEDAVVLVATRAELMHHMPAGAMLAVGLSEAAVAPLCAMGADLAAVNSAESCVLSGPIEVLAAVEKAVMNGGSAYRRLDVARAFHSRMTDECLEDLHAALSRIELRPPTIPFVSNVTGDWITDEQATSPDYWVEQTRRTVRFADGLATVFASAPDVVAEIGPGRVLSKLALRHPNRPSGLPVIATLPNAQGDESEAVCLQRALARVWTLGGDVDWAVLWNGDAQLVDLPGYPFQRNRYWPSEEPLVSDTTRVIAPAAQQSAMSNGYAPDELRAQVRAAYTKSLGTELDDTTNFFDIGDSLVAVQIVLDLRATTGRELSLREFVNHPTVEELATLLSIRTTESASDSASAAVCERVSPTVAPPVTVGRRDSSDPQFSIFFFSAASTEGNRYGLVQACARRADELGYTAIWTPERHFHQFGDLFPNSAVLSAGLATITERIHLRAGSVVAPLHHPARVAEEWAIVDNLSGGRVGLGFAPGFLPLDFVFGQASYQRKQQVTLDRIEQIRTLWRGDTIEDVNGLGERVRLQTFPRPVQPELPVWLTVSANPETFATAGRSGFNVLTALINLDPADLESRIAAYRKGRAEAGLDPAAGTVTLMVHAFLGEGDDDAVRAVVEGPFREYLWANSEILKSAAKALLDNLDFDKLTADDRETLKDFAFRRYWESSALLGGASTFAARARHLADLGVDEIACLIDFGFDEQTVLGGLERIAETMALRSRTGA